MNLITDRRFNRAAKPFIGDDSLEAVPTPIQIKYRTRCVI